jgi:hypothetical protein
MMMTDTRTNITRVVLATSVEWVCALLWAHVALLVFLLVAVTALALARLRDSARSTARMLFLQGVADDYCVSLHPRKHQSEGGAHAV